jgi:hypothetical protein
MTAMIKLRHQQPSLWHRGLAEDIEGLWEPWMLLVIDCPNANPVQSTVAISGRKNSEIRFQRTIRAELLRTPEIIVTLPVWLFI